MVGRLVYRVNKSLELWLKLVEVEVVMVEAIYKVGLVVIRVVAVEIEVVVMQREMGLDLIERLLKLLYLSSQICSRCFKCCHYLVLFLSVIRWLRSYLIRVLPILIYLLNFS